MRGVRALAGHEEEVVAAYVAGASLDELSEQHGCSVDALRTFLRAKGVRMRPSGALWPYDLETEVLIAQEYEAGFTPKKLAARYGGDERTIRKAVRKQGGTIRAAGAAPVAVPVEDAPADGGGSGAAVRILVGASAIFAVLLVGAYVLSYWNSDRPALASARETAASSTDEPAASASPTSAPTIPPTTAPAPPTTTSTTVAGPPYVVTMTTCQQVGDDLTITGTLVNRTGGSESFRVQVLVVDADGVTLDESTVTSRTLDDGEQAAWTARATSPVDLRSGGGSCRLGVVETAGA